MDHDYRVEYTQTWSGGLQYELLPSTMVEMSYMGSWTLGADNATVHNVPEPGPGSIQARRPIPQLGPIRSIRFDGKSIYHGLTFRAEQRLRNSYSYDVSYTLSTSKDDASSPGPTEAEVNLPQNVRNIFDTTGEWARSSFDHRHAFVASGTYVVPFFRGRGGFGEAVLGGWRFNAVFVAQSGAPFTVNLGVDQANIGAGPAQRPDQLRDPNLPASGQAAERWFDTSAFTLPAPFTFGTAPRNSVMGTTGRHSISPNRTTTAVRVSSPLTDAPPALSFTVLEWSYRSISYRSNRRPLMSCRWLPEHPGFHRAEKLCRRRRHPRTILDRPKG